MLLDLYLCGSAMSGMFLVYRAGITAGMTAKRRVAYLMTGLALMSLSAAAILAFKEQFHLPHS